MKFKSLILTVALAFAGIAAPAQQYVISTPSLNLYGPSNNLPYAVTVPTNTVAGVQVGTNLTAISPILPLKPFVNLGVWVQATGGGTTTSNLYANFGVTYGNVGAAPGTPFSGTNVWPNPYGTNVSTYSKNLQIPVVLNGTSNVLGYGVIPASSLYGAAGYQLISLSTDATNATPVTVSAVVTRFNGP